MPATLYPQQLIDALKWRYATKKFDPTKKIPADTWQEHQVYIALGQFMAGAALLEIDTCPMEGIEPAKFDEILGLTGTGHATVVACAAGYRMAGDKYAAIPKVRFKTEEVVVRV